MQDYISKLRQKIGNDKIIHPAARILVENDKGEFLFIYRADNGNLGLPSGGFEENETIEQCIIRETREETGIEVQSVQLIGITSAPESQSVVYGNGDQVQYFTIEFYSNDWTGEIQVSDPTEVKSAFFAPAERLQELPENERVIVDVLSDYRSTGQVALN